MTMLTAVHIAPGGRNGNAFTRRPGAGRRHTRRRVSAFTIIELVMVIGMLSALLAIVFPVFRKARDAAMRTQARNEATALAQAVLQYNNVYGYWPGTVKASGANLAINEDLNLSAETIGRPIVSRYSNTTFEVTATLSGNAETRYVDDNTLYRSLLPFDATRAGAQNMNPLNPQRIRFIDMSSEHKPDKVSMPDPWGNQYVVVMGLNPSTYYPLLLKNTDPALNQRLSVSNLTAFALSCGPDRKSLIFSAGITNAVAGGAY